MQALEREFLLGDGATGTYLAELGWDQGAFDLANIHAPDLVRQTHEAYFAAGADFVETNTFSSNRIRKGDLGVSPFEIALRGAQIAREVAGAERLVLGAIGPCGRSLQPIGNVNPEAAREAFREQAQALAEGGVNGFLFESFIDLDELELALAAVHGVSDLPILVSKAFIEDGEALLEGLPSRCAAEMAQDGVVAIGANCVVGPQRMVDIVRQLVESTDMPVLAMPTPGLPQLVKGNIVYDSDPEYFAEASMRLLAEGVRILGGCCGTTPAHIAELSKALKSPRRPKAVERRSTVVASERKPLPESEPTELSQKLGKKFVTTVEVDLPRGLATDKVLQACKQLKIAGADMIDISDGARARLRMNPLSVSKLIQDRTGIEVMMHFACRDRNVLAVQADLLGSHALGVRNILAVTGDPANIGDYPSATSVFDIDAIGMVRILSRFNEGIDLAGYSIGMKCAFTIAVAFNPLAQDAELELERLKRKVDAGAHVIYTQPIFESAVLHKTLEMVASTNLPVFVGVLPLKHKRHAEFMHHEVPGISVPAALRKQLAEAPDDEAGLAIGIASAQSLIREARQVAQGLYLMPPFGSATIAAQVMEALG